MERFVSGLRDQWIGVLALIVALGGTGAYAADELLGKNDVSSKHIADGGVKGKDLAEKSVGTKHVVNGALLSEDFAAGQIPAGPEGPRGPQGEQGIQGKEGTQGLPGPPGISGYERIVAGTGDADSPPERSLQAQCPDGKQVISGGGFVFGAGRRSVDFEWMYPNDAGRYYEMLAYEETPTDSNWGLTVMAICGVVED